MRLAGILLLLKLTLSKVYEIKSINPTQVNTLSNPTEIKNLITPTEKRVIVIGIKRYSNAEKLIQITSLNDIINNQINDIKRQSNEVEELQSSKPLVILKSTFLNSLKDSQSKSIQDLKVLEYLDSIHDQVDIIQVLISTQNKDTVSNLQCPASKQDCER